MRQKHIHKYEHLGQHHDDVAETYPSDLLVLLLIIICFKLLDGLFISLVKGQDVPGTLQDEKDDTRGHDKSTPWTVIPPECFHQKTTEHGYESDIQIELVKVALLQKIPQRV